MSKRHRLSKNRKSARSGRKSVGLTYDMFPHTPFYRDLPKHKKRPKHEKQ